MKFFDPKPRNYECEDGNYIETLYSGALEPQGGCGIGVVSAVCILGFQQQGLQAVRAEMPFRTLCLAVFMLFAGSRAARASHSVQLECHYGVRA